MEFLPITEIMRQSVADAAETYGKDITFLFGDWAYCSSQLMQWNTPETAAKKYPLVILYSPFDEERGGEKNGSLRKVSLNLLLLCNTRKEYSNEQREKFSFEQVLRPIYSALMEAINRNASIVSDYTGILPHTYRENYRYGRLGVVGTDGKPFRDYIDAIEIQKLSLSIKKICK